MEPGLLHFKNGQAAFEHSKAYLNVDLRPGNTVPALVESVVPDDKYGYIAKIAIPVRDDDVRIVTAVVKDGLQVRAGDWVAFRLEEVRLDLPKEMRYLGGIISQCPLSYSIKDGRWTSAYTGPKGAQQPLTKPGRWRQRLDTPLKRIGAIILAIGCLTFFVGAVQMIDRRDDFGWFIETWIKSVFRDGSSYRNYPTVAWGTYLIVLGLLSSFLYDKTLGKMFAWVKTG